MFLPIYKRKYLIKKFIDQEEKKIAAMNKK